MELNTIIKKFIATENYEITPITNGLINSTFLLENKDTSEKFILQKINKQIFKNPVSIIKNHLTINKKLISNNYQLEVIRPVCTSENEFLIPDENDDVWRIQNFIENSLTFLKIPSHEIAYEAAKAFSHFLDIINIENSVNIEETLPDFINFEKRIFDYQTSLKNTDSSLIEKAKREIEQTNQFLSLPDKWIELEKNNLLPKRIIHADPKISNILFNQHQKPLAVIDLDTIMISTILYDFGDMIRSYTNTTNEDDGKTENNFNPEIYKAVKEGFLFHLKDKLTHTELENLDYAAKVVIYIQAIRFLTDYLNGSIYYSTKYPEHNLDRTRNQLQLLEGLNSFLSEK
ncbi:phosphotransferase enzyme family protein [Chryseobacterium oryctis]|uniref:Aminoglycoside phosphotransferase family protein n=1 Tax=Chryseobacterium oryctis TaxID=2952618 RepID=A0ABT3HMP6_9FLAO|nr:aminoglycoside phosphotransferase family protein [Chryseobacterium oryctis]MCW3161056.1 aminoglycoside phosphotransferase family protein [Chryseobacterium oryctis]